MDGGPYIVSHWLTHNTFFVYVSYGAVVQRVFVLGVYFVAPQSMASIFSLVDSRVEPGRNIPVFISCKNESSSRVVPSVHSHTTSVVRTTGTHSMDTSVCSVCDVHRVPRGAGTRLYESIWKPSS